MPSAGSATIAVWTGSRNAAAKPSRDSITHTRPQTAVMTRMAWRKPGRAKRAFHSAVLRGSPPVWKWRATKNISGREAASEARHASPNRPKAGAAFNSPKRTSSLTSAIRIPSKIVTNTAMPIASTRRP